MTLVGDRVVGQRHMIYNKRNMFKKKERKKDKGIEIVIFLAKCIGISDRTVNLVTYEYAYSDHSDMTHIRARKT